jgi:hypothetical protein
MVRPWSWYAASLAVIVATTATSCGGPSATQMRASRYRSLARTICREYHGVRKPVRAPVASLEEHFRQLEALVRAEPTVAKLRTCIASLNIPSEETEASNAVSPPPATTRCAANGVPSLTRSDTQTALRIVRDDGTMAHLLRGVAFHVVHEGPWTTGGANNCLIGAVLWLGLARPVAVNGVVPIEDY